MQLLKEFKEFALKGNVVDLAVGVVIGGAFGKIVSSLVADMIMPLLGLLLGGINFTDFKLVLKEASIDVAGKQIEAVTLNYGTFLQVVFDFTIIAAAIFAVVKLMNTIKRTEKKKEEKVETLTKDQEILLEIRDLLKK